MSREFDPPATAALRARGSCTLLPPCVLAELQAACRVGDEMRVGTLVTRGAVFGVFSPVAARS